MGINPSRAPHRENLFWVFCRTLAQETRLSLLRELIRSPGLNVSELAGIAGLTDANISTHLKLLHTAGLVVPYRQEQQVLYRVEAPAAASFSPQILPFIVKILEKKPDYDRMIRLATAFTHQRRVEIIRLLRDGPRAADDLMDRAQIKPSSFYRQMHKLENRGFVNQSGLDYVLSCPRDPLAGALLKSALV